MTNINREKCIGCGTCTALCPEIFEIDEQGKAKVKNQYKKPCVKEAVESCPVNAISE